MITWFRLFQLQVALLNLFKLWILESNRVRRGQLNSSVLMFMFVSCFSKVKRSKSDLTCYVFYDDYIFFWVMEMPRFSTIDSLWSGWEPWLSTPALLATANMGYLRLCCAHCTLHTTQYWFRDRSPPNFTPHSLLSYLDHSVFFIGPSVSMLLTRVTSVWRSVSQASIIHRRGQVISTDHQLQESRS